ncbi:MAG: putative glycosyl transferase protein [Gammaproteobacteria bacterium]|nr:putative glycosyl transferase protein [Gammaproteobacteria bacterium]
MKILFVDASRNGWGTEQHLVSLARALAETGHCVSVVVKRDSPVAELLADRGVRVHLTAFRGGVDPRGILTILRAIRAERPDWVVTNRGKLYWTLWAIARVMGVRVALFRHLPDVKRWMTRCVLPSLVDRFFVVSEFARTRLVSRGAPAARLGVLYNPIDVEDLRSAAPQRARIRRELGIAAQDFVIGFVGRVELEKGVGVLWDALVPLMSHEPHLRLLCVGNGAELLEWQRKAAASPVGGRCHFVGWTPSIGEFYAAMDLLVAPSVAPETFCRVLAEAQASEVAVIGTQMGGISEAFAPGRSGLLVPPNDRRALRRAIRRLHDDRDLRVRFARAGRAYARSHFAAHKIAAEFIAALAEPAGNRSASRRQGLRGTMITEAPR